MSDFRAILARAKHRAAKIDGFSGPSGPTQIKSRQNKVLSELNPCYHSQRLSGFTGPRRA